MSDNRTDRPASLPSRPRPTPAPNRRDPMDAGAKAQPATPAPATAVAPASPTAARRRRSEPLVQMNIRTTSAVRDLLEDAADREDITLREAFERAVRQTWG